MTVVEVPNLYSREWNSTVQSGDDSTDDHCNILLDHFVQFKSTQEREKRTLINHTFNTAAAYVNKLLTQLKEKDFQIREVYLRFDNSMAITAIFMVDEDTFCCDKFDDAYKLAQAIEDEAVSDIFTISMHFSAKTEHLDAAVLACEGFYFRKNAT